MLAATGNGALRVSADLFVLYALGQKQELVQRFRASRSTNEYVISGCRRVLLTFDY